MNPSSLIKRGLAALCLTSATALGLSASTEHFAVPDFRGDPDTAYAVWSVFTEAADAPNTPNEGNLDAAITQFNPTAFLTGGGNIYSFAEPLEFELAADAGFEVGAVVFQTRTLGTVLDLDTITIDWTGPDGSGSLSAPAPELLFSQMLGGFGGEDLVYRWDLSLAGTQATAFTINFEAASSSLSLDAVSLDVAIVPEPAAAAVLLGLATVLVVLGWRRKA
ncbi:MAG: hypothetical protein EA425_09175 [Puniceicoccaceae bacterium]|nr:MAG: hypothetical protein EA425_09175 [Puniceicoccaceae bacterium]